MKSSEIKISKMNGIQNRCHDGGGGGRAGPDLRVVPLGRMVGVPLRGVVQGLGVGPSV